MKGEVLGAKPMETLLKRFPVRIRRDVINSVAARGAFVVKKHAKLNLEKNGNIQSGKAVKSVRTKKKKGVHGVYIVYTDQTAWYTILIELGTGPRKTKKPVPFEMMPGLWITLKNSGSMPASPFFRPALDENQKEVIQEMAKRMAKRMAKEAEKMSGKYKTLKKTYRKKLAK